MSRYAVMGNSGLYIEYLGIVRQCRGTESRCWGIDSPCWDIDCLYLGTDYWCWGIGCLCSGIESKDYAGYNSSEAGCSSRLCLGILLSFEIAMLYALAGSLPANAYIP